MKKAILLLSCSTICLSVSFGQTKWDNALSKTNAYYTTGNYAKADKSLSKFYKKALKKLGGDNEYMTTYYMYKAKTSLASGLLFEYDENINTTLNFSTKIYGETSPEHAKTQLEAAQLYSLFGNYVTAQDYIQKAKNALESSNEMDDNLSAKIQLTTAEIYSGQGYYNKALSYITEIETYFTGRAVDKETVVDESGKLKTRRLSPEEAEDRLSDYARLLTLRATTLGNQGDIQMADVEFNKSSEWIKKNLTPAHTLFAKNNYEWGKMLEANGILDLTKDVKEASFEKTLTILQKDHAPSHYLAFDLYESMLRNYLIRDENAKYRATRAEYQKIIKKYFKKSSIHHVTLNTIEFNTSLDKQKTANLQAKAGSVLSNTASIPKYHKKRVEILTFLYNVAITEKDYRNAEQYLNEILEVKKGLYGEKSPEFHLTKLKLANFYLDNTSKFIEAGSIYTGSFTNVVEKEINIRHVDYVEILNHIAKFYESNDEYDKASSTLDKALLAAQAKYDDQDVDYGVELDKIASLQIKIGNYDKASEQLKSSLNILEGERNNSKNVVHYVSALETKAQLDAIYGDFGQAEDNLNLSQKLLRRVDKGIGVNELSAEEELATLYIALGKYSATEEILVNVITQYEKVFGKESRNLINPLVDLSRLKMITGDYTEAEKIARWANSIALSIFGLNSTKTAKTFITLSEINIALGDYDKAYENISKAIKVEEGHFGREHITVAKSISQQALILFYQGGFNDKAHRLLEESLDIINKKLGNRNPKYAEELKNLAIVAIAQKNYDEAFNSLELAEKIWISKVGKRNNVNASEIYLLTGDLYYQQFNYAKAKEYYEKAKKLYAKFFNSDHPDYVKVVSKLSKVYYMQGDTNNANKSIIEAIDSYNLFIQKYFPALSEREKTKFWNTIKHDFEFYNTIAITQMAHDPKLVEKMYNNALTTKALLLSSSIKIRQNIMTSGDTVLINNYSNWLSKKELLTQALSMSDEQLIENDINQAALSSEVELLEKQLSEQSTIFSQSSQDKRITWENVRDALSANEVAVEMIRIRYFDHVFTDSVIYALLYVKNDGKKAKPGISLINQGKELEHKFFKVYRNSIIYKIEDRFSYEAYWKPLKEIAGEYGTIYLSADGVFNQINLEAIPTGDGKYVLDNSNIILVSNTKEIYFNKIRTRNIQPEKRALMFGNPDFYLSATASNKITDLPGTAREINELKTILRNNGWIAQDYMELAAQEGEVKNLDNPKVFHIATHGFFKPSEDSEAQDNSLEVNKNKAYENPLLRTGLLLSGAGDILDHTETNFNSEAGILTAYEAMNLNLDQTELVVLSACETGLGDLQVGEGVYGLQRAFLVAGAKTLIMSMFKVDDDATQMLMVNFYKKWLETGEMRKSFINAKKEVRNVYKEPIYWGSFIMIGMD